MSGKDSAQGRRTVVLHPFLFAVWPVLFIYAQNLEHIPFSQARSSLLVLSASTLVLLALLAIILRSWMKAGAVLSLLLLLIFSFGHVYSLLWKDLPAFAKTSEALALAISWAFAFLIGTALVLRTRSLWAEITKIVNAVSLTLIVVTTFNIGVHELREGTSRRDISKIFDIPESESESLNLLPNIYYIILDAYAREDILQESYGYDNSTFLRSLTDQDFYVAGKSRANYAQTELSLASSLNFGYLDDLARVTGSESEDRRPLEDLIQRSAVVGFLEEQGYEILSLSGYYATDLRTADIQLGIAPAWNDLETRLLCSTPIAWLADAGRAFDLSASHRQTIVHALDHLADTAHQPGPQFVLAHVLAPHGPFVFDKDGNEIDYERQFNLQDGVQYDEQGQVLEEYIQGYTGQLAFISTRIRPVLESLITRSVRPTIVILQSDHGPGYPLEMEDPDSAHLRQKMSILNAYFFPDGDYDDLYQEITPVNTFRVIFNQYLGTDLELLEDRSYYSTWERPYQFVDVTDKVRSGGE